MSRRIILVEPFWTRDKDPRVPLGHASLLAALRERPDLDVRGVAIPVNRAGVTAEALVESLMELTDTRPPESVDIAIGAYVWAEDLVQAVLPRLRARGFRGRLILGGPQISYSGDGLEKIYPHADVFVRGYGEVALVDVATTTERTAMPGVHYAGSPDRVDQAAVDLDLVPSPWLSGVIPVRDQAFLRWETQRGCPFRCSFCQHREAGSRLKQRQLARERVLAEAKLFCDSGVRDIAVLDPIFNLGPASTALLREFASLGYRGRLSLQCRAETLDAAFLEAASALDVRLELGLQTVHDREGTAIRRRNDMQKVDRSLAEIRRLGIAHEVSLIFGLPEQTLSSFVESVRWCLERAVPVIKAFPLMLLRGTELERDRHRWALRESGGPMPVVIESRTFGSGDWRAMAQLSEALRLTEGRHPSIEELSRLAMHCEPNLGRWSPEQ